MSKREQRWVARTACDIPARILSRGGWCTVVIRDLSRLGLRAGMTADAIGLPRSASIGTLARRLAELLPEEPPVELNHRSLGLLVTRRLRIVRVRPARGHSRFVELGCLFDRPLDDDEAAALGIVLPRSGESLEEAIRRQAPHPPRPRTPELSPEAQEADEELFEGLTGDAEATEA